MENRGHDLSALRQLNVRAVLGLLLESTQPLTVRDIALGAHVSRPTVEASLAVLAEEGIVMEALDAPQPGRLGRPARSYGLRTSENLIVALDTGPHGVKGILADVRGTHIHDVAIGDVDLRDDVAAFAGIVSVVDRLLAETPHQRRSIGTIAMGVPGIVSEGGSSLISTVVPKWAGADLIRRVRVEFPDADVLIDNDVKLAALGEREKGALRCEDNSIFMLLGKRMAAAAFIGGHLIRGEHGGAGELGAWKFLGWDSAYDRLLYNSSHATSAAVFSAADRGDTLALRAVETYAKDLAEGLTALVLTLDPSMVILGGSIANEGSNLREMVARHLKRDCLFPPTVEYSKLRAKGVMTGAVAFGAAHARAVLLANRLEAI